MIIYIFYMYSYIAMAMAISHTQYIHFIECVRHSSVFRRWTKFSLTRFFSIRFLLLFRRLLLDTFSYLSLMPFYEFLSNTLGTIGNCSDTFFHATFFPSHKFDIGASFAFPMRKIFCFLAKKASAHIYTEKSKLECLENSKIQLNKYDNHLKRNYLFELNAHTERIDKRSNDGIVLSCFPHGEVWHL